VQQSERTAADASSASALAAQGAPATGLDLTSHPPDGLTWHGYLIQLLHIASEIEHALMVQYLYAAYSLNDERPNLSPAERGQVAQWRSLILSVAKEEMGHLLTVQNVLCLLGGQMELVRENYPFDSAFYPFPFRLERLSLGSLACYIFAEMGEYPPDETDTAFLRRVLKLVEDRLNGGKKRRSLKSKLRHSAHRVGELYQKISEILEDPKRIPDSLLAYESVPCQASADEWGRGYGIEPLPSISNPVSKSGRRRYADVVRRSEMLCKRIGAGATHAHIMIETAATRQQALDALKRIAVQGEGRGIEPDSHFMRFRSIMQDFLEHRTRNRSWSPPTYAVAEDPQIRWPDVHDVATGKRITHPLSERWGNMFNLRYRMLLTYLSHSFQLARDGTEARLRGAVIHRVFAEMYNIKAIAGILVRLPLTSRTSDTRCAGPPFQMPYTLAISMDPMDRWRLHLDLLTGARDLNDVIDRYLSESDGRPSLNARFLDWNLQFLRAMRELDRKSEDWIKKVIVGMAREKASPL
jgi:Ferritin-like